MPELMNFDTELDLQHARRVTVRTDIPAVVDTLTVAAHPRVNLTREGPIRPAAALVQSGEEWDWHTLRDFVVDRIECRFGFFPRNPLKEAAIFKSFIERWPDGKAASIARFAFDRCDGRWAGAPISINRFCKASDPFFAVPVLKMVAAFNGSD